MGPTRYRAISPRGGFLSVAKCLRSNGLRRVPSTLAGELARAAK